MTLYLRLPNHSEHAARHGYFVVNRTGGDADNVILEGSLGSRKWQESGAVPYRVEGNQMHIAVPRTLLGLKNKPLTLEFKWMDTAAMDGRIDPFYTDGDAAPIGRFYYVFRSEP